MFRLGFRLGLLAGLGYALARILQSRQSPATLDLGDRGSSLGPTPGNWPPLEAPTITPTPIEVPGPGVEPLPPAAGEEPGLVLIDDEASPAPVAAPVEKKVAPKKAAPRKKAAAKKAGGEKKAAAVKKAAKKTPPPEATELD